MCIYLEILGCSYSFTVKLTVEIHSSSLKVTGAMFSVWRNKIPSDTGAWLQRKDERLLCSRRPRSPVGAGCRPGSAGGVRGLKSAPPDTGEQFVVQVP